jgi:hypothetical protein
LDESFQAFNQEKANLRRSLVDRSENKRPLRLRDFCDAALRLTTMLWAQCGVRLSKIEFGL